MTLKTEKPVNNGRIIILPFLLRNILSEKSKMSDEFGIVVAPCNT